MGREGKGGEWSEGALVNAEATEVDKSQLWLLLQRKEERGPGKRCMPAMEWCGVMGMCALDSCLFFSL